MSLDALPHPATPAARRAQYADLRQRLDALLAGETDEVALMATIACELHHAFEAFHWTGFYRAVAPDELAIGPYQGGHGCLRIHFSRGVCGAAARTRETQLVPDVEAFPGHIACSSSTRSEVVVPVISPRGRLIGVLDVDSDHPDAFDSLDVEALEHICRDLAERAEPGGLE